MENQWAKVRAYFGADELHRFDVGNGEMDIVFEVCVSSFDLVILKLNTYVLCRIA